ncbi:Ilys-4 [Dirofilaria immitis]|nr:Ilys-4 [Dirofilaria immitis]
MCPKRLVTRTSMEGMDAAIFDSTSITIKYGNLFQLKEKNFLVQNLQCYQPGKENDQDEEEAWLTCAKNYECSQECLRRLSNRYKLKCYGKGECETLARIHDGGANGCRSKDTLIYWNIVKQKCPHC